MATKSWGLNERCAALGWPPLYREDLERMPAWKQAIHIISWANIFGGNKTIGRNLYALVKVPLHYDALRRQEPTEIAIRKALRRMFINVSKSEKLYFEQKTAEIRAGNLNALWSVLETYEGTKNGPVAVRVPTPQLQSIPTKPTGPPASATSNTVQNTPAAEEPGMSLSDRLNMLGISKWPFGALNNIEHSEAPKIGAWWAANLKKDGCTLFALRKARAFTKLRVTATTGETLMTWSKRLFDELPENERAMYRRATEQLGQGGVDNCLRIVKLVLGDLAAKEISESAMQASSKATGTTAEPTSTSLANEAEPRADATPSTPDEGTAKTDPSSQSPDLDMNLSQRLGMLWPDSCPIVTLHRRDVLEKQDVCIARWWLCRLREDGLTLFMLRQAPMFAKLERPGQTASAFREWSIKLYGETQPETQAVYRQGTAQLKTCSYEMKIKIVKLFLGDTAAKEIVTVAETLRSRAESTKDDPEAEKAAQVQQARQKIERSAIAGKSLTVLDPHPVATSTGTQEVGIAARSSRERALPKPDKSNARIPACPQISPKEHAAHPVSPLQEVSTNTLARALETEAEPAGKPSNLPNAVIVPQPTWNLVRDVVIPITRMSGVFVVGEVLSAIRERCEGYSRELFGDTDESMVISSLTDVLSAHFQDQLTAIFQGPSRTSTHYEQKIKEVLQEFDEAINSALAEYGDDEIGGVPVA